MLLLWPVLGHKKAECRSLKSDKPDKVNAVCDFACPVSSYPVHRMRAN